MGSRTLASWPWYAHSFPAHSRNTLHQNTARAHGGLINNLWSSRTNKISIFIASDTGQSVSLPEINIYTNKLIYGVFCLISGVLNFQWPHLAPGIAYRSGISAAVRLGAATGCHMPYYWSWWVLLQPNSTVNTIPKLLKLDVHVLGWEFRSKFWTLSTCVGLLPTKTKTDSVMLVCRVSSYVFEIRPANHFRPWRRIIVIAHRVELETTRSVRNNDGTTPRFWH